jgi:hypothetical protein
MHSDLPFITRTLDLPTPETTLLVLTCFNYYVTNFLSRNPLVLDPDIAHILARVRLTMTRPPTRWLWLQDTAEAWEEMGQEEHATIFVLRVLSYMASEGLWATDSGVSRAVCEIHQWLCKLQSLWLGNGVWIEDVEMEAELRKAIWRVMQGVN